MRAGSINRHLHPVKPPLREWGSEWHGYGRARALEGDDFRPFCWVRDIDGTLHLAATMPRRIKGTAALLALRGALPVPSLRGAAHRIQQPCVEHLLRGPRVGIFALGKDQHLALLVD